MEPQVKSAAAGVERDLAEIAKADGALASGGLAETARKLATIVDDDENSATSRAMAAKALQSIIVQLLGLRPMDDDADELDQLRR